MKLAIVGATGNVGQVMLDLLGQEPWSEDAEIIPLASKRSSGQTITFRDQEIRVRELTEKEVDVDYALISAGKAPSARFAPLFADKGAYVIDNSSQWRRDRNVPLIVYGINHDILKTNTSKIIANPNCTTMIMSMALGPLDKLAKIKRLVLSSYQSVSGSGRLASLELEEQLKAWALQKDIPKPKIYPHQIAMNVFPQVEGFSEGSDLTTEEEKIIFETQKILGRSLPISAAAARVPVVTGHSVSCNIEFEEPITKDAACKALNKQEGLVLLEDSYPTALLAQGQEDVFVGRVREDWSQQNTLNLWVSGDNLLKGAALNAIQVLNYLLDKES
jgi:aspartate-semialdehyde dehydrogenase